MNLSAPPDRATRASPRVGFLDSIRGLAALIVLLSHTLGLFALSSAASSWARWPLIDNLFDGRSAVTMFFVLSGYVLSRPYLVPVAPGVTTRHLFWPTFYLRRVTRIWIPWAFAFVLSAVAQAFLCRPWPMEPPMSDWLHQFWQIPLTWQSVLRQSTFTLHDPARLLLPQDWSLGVELKGSALIPIFLFLVRGRLVLFAIFLGALLLGLSTGAYYVSFGLGVLTARYHSTLLTRLRNWPIGWRWTLFAVGCTLYQARYGGGFFWDVNGLAEKVVWCFTSAGCVCILVSALTLSPLQDILEHRWLTMLGRISYSIYLLQFAVLIAVLPPFVFALNRFGIRQISMLLPLTFLASVSTTLLLSCFTYRWVEIPSIALGHWLTARVRQHFARRLPDKQN